MEWRTGSWGQTLLRELGVSARPILETIFCSTQPSVLTEETLLCGIEVVANAALGLLGSKPPPCLPKLGWYACDILVMIDHPNEEAIPCNI